MNELKISAVTDFILSEVFLLPTWEDQSGGVNYFEYHEKGLTYSFREFEASLRKDSGDITYGQQLSKSTWALEKLEQEVQEAAKLLRRHLVRNSVTDMKSVPNEVAKRIAMEFANAGKCTVTVPRYWFPIK